MSWFSRLLGVNQAYEDEPRCPIRFDLTGWHPQRRDATSRKWRWKDDDGHMLTVHVEQAPAFASGDAADLRRLRAVCRETASQTSASMVQVDPIQVAAIPGVLVITKARHGLGASYVGRMLFPLVGPHYVVQMEAAENSVTGERDAIAGAALAQIGEIELEPPESPGTPGRRIKGWFQDPYDPALDRDALNCVSDDERLDALLPKHPLSKIRAVLALIRNTATLDPSPALESASSWRPATADTSEPRRGRMPSLALGMLCFQAGLFHQSEQAFADSIAEWEAGGRGADPDLANHLVLLGLSYDCQGKHRDAVPIFQRSERAATAALGPDHPVVAQAVNNQARALIALNDHTAAEPLFERALAMFESVEGQETNAAVALNGLGMVRNCQERYAEAIPLLERALKIFEKEYGAQFQDCGAVWGHLATAFAHTGDERRANHALSRARAILGIGRA
jgi:tetratricopeptide (TPR) repeat protein